MTWQQGTGGWQWQQSGASSSSGCAPQVQQYSAKELEAWRSGTWSEWTCTNCQAVRWSGQKKCRHCGVKKSYAAALSPTKVQSWSGWTTETKQLVTGLSATSSSGGTTTICMWKRSSTGKPKPGNAYSRVFLVRGGHTANQTSGESSRTWMLRRWNLRGKC